MTRYSFTYVDQVVDSYLRIGLKPFLELGFMPSALASGDQTVFWWKGNVTPPRSHDDWAALVRAVLRHLIDRYGLDEVRTWPIEVWNEPNLTVFWEGADQAAYHRLYEVTARAVKDVDASLQVGGPVLSPGSDEWWAPFADFVAARDVPIDFVSRHAYSSGPAQQVPFGVYQTFERPQALLDQFDAPRRLPGGHRARGPAGAHQRVQHLLPPRQPGPRHRLERRLPGPGAGRRRGPGRLVLLLDVLRRVRGGGHPDLAVPRRLRAADPPPGAQADLPPVRVHGPHGRGPSWPAATTTSCAATTTAA